MTREVLLDWADHRCNHTLTSNQLIQVVNTILTSGFISPNIIHEIVQHYSINEICDKNGNHIRWY